MYDRNVSLVINGTKLRPFPQNMSNIYQKNLHMFVYFHYISSSVLYNLSLYLTVWTGQLYAFWSHFLWFDFKFYILWHYFFHYAGCASCTLAFVLMTINMVFCIRCAFSAVACVIVDIISIIAVYLIHYMRRGCPSVCSACPVCSSIHSLIVHDVWIE